MLGAFEQELLILLGIAGGFALWRYWRSGRLALGIALLPLAGMFFFRTYDSQHFLGPLAAASIFVGAPLAFLASLGAVTKDRNSKEQDLVDVAVFLSGLEVMFVAGLVFIRYLSPEG